MTFPCASPTMKLNLQINPATQTRIHVPISSNIIPISQSLTPTSSDFNLIISPIQKSRFPRVIAKASNEADMPSMSEILEASRAQKLDLQLQTLGPFFRITARSLVTERELGRAEGLIRIWVGVEGGSRILHMDSIRLRRETLGMEKSIFGLGLYIGAVAIRHGYDCGCKTAQLLAINDSHLYHSKVILLPTLSDRKQISTLLFFPSKYIGFVFIIIEAI